MWCVTSSPLILGLDLRDAASVDAVWPIITNKEAIDVNRAWPPVYAGTNSTPGRMVATDGVSAHGTIVNITWQVWAKNVSSDATAVLLVNAGEVAQNVSVSLGGLLWWPAMARVRDVWRHTDLGTVDMSKPYVVQDLSPHDSAFLVFSMLGKKITV
jgi:hypothetical protein